MEEKCSEELGQQEVGAVSSTECGSRQGMRNESQEGRRSGILRCLEDEEVALLAKVERRKKKRKQTAAK